MNSLDRDPRIRRGYGHCVDYFINTEYIDLEQQMDLVSLALVAADGREFYAISTEFNPEHANTYVRTVVLPLLEPRHHPAWMSRNQMRSALLAFIGKDIPTFWSWGAAPWDWMGMAQLFPLADRVPDGWSYTCFDVSLLAESLGLSLNPVDPSLPQLPTDVHHALADARWIHDVHTALRPRLGDTTWAHRTETNPSGASVDVFIDAEFIETETQIDLISIAAVTGDGLEFYAVSHEFDPAAANDFVRTTVLPQLETSPDIVCSRADIKDQLLAFVGDASPRFWAWGGAPYDYLVIARLFAPAERMPDRWRYTAYDLTQLVAQAAASSTVLGLPDPPLDAHHALADARWARDVYDSLVSIA